MGPFNYPLNETFTTLIPALIMGNTGILKPPRHGALLYAPLVDAFCQIFPKGVVNIIYGEGRKMILPLMASGKINVLGLIGTSKTANALKKQHPHPNRLRCVLGLEAKNPAIVLKGTDLDLAVKECVLGCLSFNGQRCTALKILFVQADIVEAFLERFTAAVNALSFGMPWQEGVFVTPVAEKGKTDYLKGLVSDAVEKGADIVNINSQCQRGPDSFPFTGRKDSAEGMLSVSDALRVFSIRTLVAAKQTSANKQIITAIVRDRKSKFLATDFIL